MIRPYAPEDRDALYRICVATGDAGGDASGQFDDPSLLGDVFVGPYLELEPDMAWVVDTGSGAEGYIVGTADTTAFDARCRRHWWPRLQEQYRGRVARPGVRDGWLLDWVMTPPPPPVGLDSYPAHLHIDLLPSCQGDGWGRRVVDRLTTQLHDRGVPGVHLGVDSRNERAVGFYEHLGFRLVKSDADTLWMGQLLG